MTQSKPHDTLTPAAEDWLIWLSDPSPVREPPRYSLQPRELPLLFKAAEMHGTLPSCLTKLKRSGIAELIVEKNAGEVRAAVDTWAERGVELVAVQMNLDYHGQRAERALQQAGLAFLRVKGKTFADRLYPTPGLRGYTDVDLLIPVQQRELVSAALSSLGFQYHAMKYRQGEDYFEDKWVIIQGAQEVLIEVHGNLVHNPRLRRYSSLDYADVLEAGGGEGSDATALLLVAGTHGAASHQFDRLQHVVDVLQCARGAAGVIDTQRLHSVTERRGLTFAIIAALYLAGRTFGEPRCTEIIRSLAPRAFDSLASHLLSGRMVIAAQSSARAAMSWRRKAFRQALRFSGRRTRATRA